MGAPKWAKGLSDDDCKAVVAAMQGVMQMHMQRTLAAIDEANYDAIRAVSLCNLAAALEAHE